MGKISLLPCICKVQYWADIMIWVEICPVKGTPCNSKYHNSVTTKISQSTVLKPNIPYSSSSPLFLQRLQWCSFNGLQVSCFCREHSIIMMVIVRKHDVAADSSMSKSRKWKPYFLHPIYTDLLHCIIPLLHGLSLHGRFSRKLGHGLPPWRGFCMISRTRWLIQPL